MLGLVEEAVRREIHFLQRHPTTLFQCVWNSGWWYDCPQAAAHYVAGRSPGQEAGVGLHRWLEEWRAAKEQRQPGFVWLRSLRPPAVHLGTAQKAVFRGHESRVKSVAYAPDGLTDMLDDDRVAAILAAEGEPESACKRLVDEANEAGGCDNITAIVARLEAI